MQWRDATWVYTGERLISWIVQILERLTKALQLFCVFADYSG